jgi:hypothetical protein
MSLESKLVTWSPIEPLSENEKSIDLADIQSLYSAWREAKNRFSRDKPDELEEFNKRLVRRLSIETGILERLYDLDRGTTEALVLKGFVEDLVNRSSTDINPARLIDILRDQEAAIQIVMDWIGNSRPLTKSGMHELHVTLTRHQDTTTAVDQFDKRIEIELLKGKFKQFPNNPKRSDGSTHEYCPPIHVDAEIEKLLQLHRDYLEAGVDPVIHASWLHHRFTQIHPYQDGNGRVVRALTTFVLLRSNLLPLVVDRDKRVQYIESLERADQGNLSELTQFLANLERSAIMQALSVETAATTKTSQSVSLSVIDALKQKLVGRQELRSAEYRQVNGVAQSLRNFAKSQTEMQFDNLKDAFKGHDNAQVKVESGGTDFHNSHWYKYEVVQTAKEAGKFANLSENHYFLKSTIKLTNDRLVFVISFHHVGHELSGVMEVTAFAKLESSGDPGEQSIVGQKFLVCSVEPFVLTNKSNASDIRNAFLQWLDLCIAVAFKEFGDRL